MRNHPTPGVYSRKGIIAACLILFVVGTVFLIISASLRGAFAKDISAYESTIGNMGYTTSRHDGSTMYRAYATYYVDGQEYKWESKTSISPMPETWEMGKDVEVFYDPANPSDSTVPELAKAPSVLISVFLIVGIALVSVSILALGLPVLRVILAAGVVGATSKAMDTNETPNNTNGVNLGKN